MHVPYVTPTNFGQPTPQKNFGLKFNHEINVTYAKGFGSLSVQNRVHSAREGKSVEINDQVILSQRHGLASVKVGCLLGSLDKGVKRHIRETKWGSIFMIMLTWGTIEGSHNAVTNSSARFSSAFVSLQTGEPSAVTISLQLSFIQLCAWFAGGKRKVSSSKQLERKEMSQKVNNGVHLSHESS